MTAKTFALICDFTTSHGYGNVLRSLVLAGKSQELAPTKLINITQHAEKLSHLLPEESEFETIFVKSVDESKTLTKFATHLLIDCGSSDFVVKIAQIKDENSMIKITALDYFENNPHIDLRISLFNQNNNSFEGETENSKVGLKYCILDRVLQEIEPKENRKGIIVRFSGAPSNLLTATKKAIDTAGLNRIHHIRYFDNTRVSAEKNFLPKSQFLEALSECALYIGSGTTSFLEATYLRTPTIFIGVNHLERRFGSALALKFGIKNIDLEVDHLASSLANEIELSFNGKDLGQNLDIDLNGVDRVLDLVMSL